MSTTKKSTLMGTIIALTALATFICVGGLAFATPAYASTINSSLAMPPNNLGLVGWWTFDGANMVSNVADSSGQGNNGNLVGYTATTTVPGVAGQALKFNGTSQYVDLGTNTPAAGASSATFSAWVYSKVDQSAAIINKWDGSVGYSFIFNTATGNNVLLGVHGPISTNSLYGYSTGGALTVNKWHHVVGVWTGGNTLKVYIDGVLQGFNYNTSVSIDTISNSITELSIGAQKESATWGSFLNGFLDDVRIYNRALSASEITQMYNASTGSHTNASINPLNLANGLVGWWTFDGNQTNWSSPTAGTTNDSSGNGLTGTLNNMTQTGSPVVGKIGQGLSFNGSNSSITTGSFSSSGDFTFSAWVYVKGNGTANYNNIVLVNNAPFRQLYIQNTTNEVLYYGSAPLSSGYFVPLNKWQLITFTSNGTTATFFVNGVAVSTQTATEGGATGALNIGGFSTFGNSNMNMDDFRIYNRALSAGEVSQLYGLGTATHVNASINPLNLQSGLVGWWTFDGANMVSNVADSSGQGNNGNLINYTSTTTVPGVIGQALKFNNTTNYIDFGSTALLTAGSSFSLSWWEKVTTDVNTYPGRFVIKLNGTTDHLVVLRTNNAAYGPLSFGPSPSGTTVRASGQPSTASGVGIWRHYVITGSNPDSAVPSNYSLYVNGVSYVLDGGGTFSAVTGNRIGYLGVNNGADATLDDVRIYNRALSAGEVSQLYSLGH